MAAVPPPPKRIPQVEDQDLGVFLRELSKTVELMWEVTKAGQQATITTLALTDVSGTGDDATINANIVLLETAVNGLKTALDNLGATGE